MPSDLTILDLDVEQAIPDGTASPVALERQGARAMVLRHRGRPAYFRLLEDGEDDTIDAAARTALVRERLLDEIAPALGGVPSDWTPAPPPGGVTVAVCTHNRPALVAQCVGALVALRERHRDGDGDPFAILVVDNNPPDKKAAAVVAEFPRVGYVVEPRAGLDFARNRALATATTAYLAFLDDDTIVDSAWWAGLCRALTEHPDAAAVTGLVLPYELATDAQLLFERRGGFRRGHLQRRYGRDEPRDRIYPCGAGQFGAGANMVVAVAAARMLGGFDEALDTGAPLPGGGDLDMFYRIVRHAGQLIYEPHMAVRHRHRAERAELRRQYYTWGTGMMAFVAKTARAERGDPAQRRRVRVLATWWFREQVERLAAARRGADPTPFDMVAAELLGGLVGLAGTYRRSQRRVRGISAAASGEPPTARFPASAISLRRTPPPARTGRRHPAPMFAPRTMMHLDLGRPEDVKAVLGSRNENRHLMVWWDNLALAAVHLPAGEPPTAESLARSVAQAVAPAVADRVEAGNSGARVPIGAALDGHTRRLAVGGDIDAGDISVVVCTRNRPDALSDCLNALAAQTIAPGEVIVVDNDPADGRTAAVVERHQRAGRLALTYQAEPQAGLSQARNTGVAVARGAVVAFTDDDVTVHPDWVWRLAAAFNGPGVASVTGLVLPTELATAAQVVFEVTGGFGAGFVRRRFDGTFLTANARKGAPVWRLGAGANMAVRREPLEAVGGFDVRLGAGAAGCSEDSELWYRLLLAGWVCQYDPAAVVFHGHRATLGELQSQTRAYLRGHVAALAVQAAYDPRRGNLRRLFGGLPRYLVAEAWRSWRGDQPARTGTVTAAVRGYLEGLWQVPSLVRGQAPPAGPRSASAAAGAASPQAPVDAAAGGPTRSAAVSHGQTSSTHSGSTGQRRDARRRAVG